MTSPRHILSSRQVILKAIPIQKAEVHDTAYTANADMLAADITPTPVGPDVDAVYPPVVFRISVCLDTAAVFKIIIDDVFRISVCLDTAAVFKIIIDDGTSEVDIALNSGAQLTAQAGYTFDWPIDEGDTVNFEADQDVQIEKLIVHEVIWASQ